jgi:hypothetical protein
MIIQNRGARVPVLQGKEETDRAHHRSAGDSSHLGVPGSAKQPANPVAGPVASLTGGREDIRFDFPVPLRPGPGSGTYTTPYQKVRSYVCVEFGPDSCRIAALFSLHLLWDRMRNV